ncbi:MAG: aspartate-semialdehyde dehydrogenase [Fibrobacterales bacterium]
MSKNIAIMGASGAVGQELLKLIEERNFPFKTLKLLVSKRSAGKKITFMGTEYTMEELTHDSFEGIDIVLSSAGGSISKEFCPSAVKAGAVVVDNTSFYRMDPTVPLVVPEVNPEAIADHNGIIANPNCTTILMLVALAPLHRKFGVKRCVTTTYQSASGAGAIAMEELRDEAKALAEGNEYERSVIPHQYAFNLFPHNSPMQENGYCEEEWKMVKESKKILNDESFNVTCTSVRVPVLRAHSEALNVQFDKPVTVEEIYGVLNEAEGVEVFENRAENRWPMPIDVTDKDPVFAGRVRKDVSLENTYDIWIVGDQVRKGAALNAIQIAEKL